VLHHHGGGAVGELTHGVERGVHVDQVVEGQLLAALVQRLRQRQAAGLCVAIDVERAALVRVLAVAHVVALAEAQRERARVGRAGLARHVGGDRAVVGGRVGEGLGGQLGAQLERGLARDAERLEYAAVVGRLGHDGDAAVVLGGAAHHGRAADVDVLDDLVVLGAGRHRLLERVEVHAHEADGLAPDAGQRGAVLVQVAHEDAAVHARVQGLHAPVHDLGGLRVLRHVDYREARFAQRLGGAAGREDLDALGSQSLGKLNDSGLVRDRHQRSFDAQNATSSSA
jgi:hypothetical protein